MSVRELDYSYDEAVKKAAAFAKKKGQPTFVFFTFHHQDYGDRFDWCTEDQWHNELYTRDDRILWSSVEGSYPLESD